MANSISRPIIFLGKDRLIVPSLCFRNKLVFLSMWIRFLLFPPNFALMPAAIWFHCSLKNGESNFPVRVWEMFNCCFLWDGKVASDTLNVVFWQLHNISWQRVVVSRFYIIYCQSKTVHPVFGFHFRGSLFCVDFVGLYSFQWEWDFIFNCCYIKSYIKWIWFLLRCVPFVEITKKLLSIF